ncbi:MAG: restriction endonuclease subunit R [Deltaproteobacteria bacterium HGW-Deltaproteobacteria-18]|jgi:type I restriction enzyme R subunit|nr:MAG: restriction endonuclease subunit R [Deltaproteobacteria bacterium HGW-Deltaproteobacteria-18]
MESQNFEMLRAKWSHLADLGAFAEQYLYDDPPSALVKLRNYAEQMVLWIYEVVALEMPESQNLYDLLKADVFTRLVDSAVQNKFHIIRKIGNAAAHGRPATVEEAKHVLREAYDLGCWLYVTAGQGNVSDCTQFAFPPKISRDQATVLAAKESELQRISELLEEERKKAKEAKMAVEALKKSAQIASSELKFSEEETRKRLIDLQLAEVGWNVDDSNAVSLEWEISDQPTKTGKGYADYVLWGDDDMPLAVIEAKKTSGDAKVGKKQAECYADGLEKEYGQRPVIFYTNGFDIFIWDDHKNQGYPERKIYGFYSKDSLQYLVKQRDVKADLSTVELNRDIAGRKYQLDAIRNALGIFTDKRRKGLFVLGTGTGKTRIAVSLTEALSSARWARRILFLCDRLELRKQAKNAFQELTDFPLIEVTSSTYRKREFRVYLATYPAMLKVYQTFDVGFFDLIIADESHRSIYNVYGDIFKYFDSLQIGLTATPRSSISHNTFEMFQCQDQDPTFYYSYDEGVEDDFLCPFELFTHTTKFLRDGIKYRDMTEEQRKELEESGYDSEFFDFEQQQIDKQIYNKDTNRKIIKNLMEYGLRDATEQLPGKSIIFARNHRHAMLIVELFDEMYPQLGGKFCQVIDNYDPRAEQLIDDFKDPDHDLTIAVSVDMLDTGIDVPEVVNLVFAKPLKSYVKFWQMIGRGTRLCKDLYGPGKDKSIFRIFDHWGNFDYFEENATEAEPGTKKSLMQLLFEARIKLAETALQKGELEIFGKVVRLIQKDIIDLPETSINVRDKWRQKRSVEPIEVLERFSPDTAQLLKAEIAPLMQWVNIRGRAEAKAFDMRIALTQNELLVQGSRLEDLKNEIQDQVSLLPMHLNQVRQKAETIKNILKQDFWDSVSFDGLEEVRSELRGIMKYKERGGTQPPLIPVIDVKDGDIQFQRRKTTLTAMDMEAYRRRLHAVLEPLFTENVTLKKIRTGESVSEGEMKSVLSMAVAQVPNVEYDDLLEFYPEAAPLDVILRSIVGMEIEVVKEKFAHFQSKYWLDPMQSHFLTTLQRIISKNGAIKVAQLYDAPFTDLHANGLDGVFHDNDEQIDAIIDIVTTFDPETYKRTEL